MLEINSKDFYKVASLFGDQTPNLPVVLAVVEQRNPGKIWVNQIENPSICLVISDGGYSFIGKKDTLNQASISEIIGILKANQPIKLIWKNNDIDFELFEKAGFSKLERIHFYHPAIMRHDLSLINAICDRLPQDIEVKLIDASLFKKSYWLPSITLFYGSEDNFLKHGFGLALIKNNEILSEAFACYIGKNLVETGSVTSEKHRGKGYATLIRAFLMKEIISRGFMPTTSCNADNVSSAKASMKLGYEEEYRYQFLVI